MERQAVGARAVTAQEALQAHGGRGAVALYRRPWRSAAWPAGELYWECRLVPLPMTQREAEAAHMERWRIALEPGGTMG